MLRSRVLLRLHRHAEVVELLGPALKTFVGVDEECTARMLHAVADRAGRTGRSRTEPSSRARSACAKPLRTSNDLRRNRVLDGVRLLASARLCRGRRKRRDSGVCLRGRRLCPRSIAPRFHCRRARALSRSSRSILRSPFRIRTVSRARSRSRGAHRPSNRVTRGYASQRRNSGYACSFCRTRHESRPR